MSGAVKFTSSGFDAEGRSSPLNFFNSKLLVGYERARDGTTRPAGEASANLVDNPSLSLSLPKRVEPKSATQTPTAKIS